MRTSNSIKNIIFSVISNFLSIMIGFISQRIFINILNAEYLGINGLFSNILSMLSIADLGIGEAIIFHLYAPIAKDEKEKVKPLLNLYKKAYNIIAIVIFILGLFIIPFLNFFIGKTTLDLNFKFIYFIFLLQTVCSYVLTYKRSILYAYQKNYIINIISIVYLLILNISQLVILFLTKNYYLYLIIKIICILLENIVINAFANKKYPYIKDKNIEKLDKKIEKDIFSRIKAQLVHKVSSFIVNSTDNILISKFLGLLTVGLYSNYNMIISAVRGLFSQFIYSITASVGNLLVENDKEKSFQVYKKLRFFNFWISTFTAICILVLMQNFIIIWLGKKYLLSTFVLIILVMNFYMKMMRATNEVFLTAAGICRENRFVPVLESILNIIFSIVLYKYFELAGIFMGTIVSGFALWFYGYPIFLYKKLFGKKYSTFVKENCCYVLLFILLAAITYKLSLLIVVNNILFNFIISLLLCIILPNVLLFLLFRKTENFKYFLQLIKNILEKVKDKFRFNSKCQKKIYQ